MFSRASAAWLAFATTLLGQSDLYRGTVVAKVGDPVGGDLIIALGGPTPPKLDGRKQTYFTCVLEKDDGSTASVLMRDRERLHWQGQKLPGGVALGKILGFDVNRSGQVVFRAEFNREDCLDCGTRQGIFLGEKLITWVSANWHGRKVELLQDPLINEAGQLLIDTGPAFGGVEGLLAPGPVRKEPPSFGNHDKMAQQYRFQVRRFLNNGDAIFMGVRSDNHVKYMSLLHGVLAKDDQPIIRNNNGLDLRYDHRGWVFQDQPVARLTGWRVLLTDTDDVIAADGAQLFVARIRNGRAAPPREAVSSASMHAWVGKRPLDILSIGSGPGAEVALHLAAEGLQAIVRLDPVLAPPIKR